MATNPRSDAPLDLAGAALRREIKRNVRRVSRNKDVLTSNPEAERGLLGSMLLEYDAFVAGTDHLTPDDFGVPRHQLIFEAISNTPRVGDGVVDVVMLNEELKREGTLAEVGQAYTHDLVNTCENAYRYREYLRIVLDCSIARQTQALGRLLSVSEISSSDAALRLAALEERRARVVSGQSTPRQIGVVASDVQPEPIRWLWKRRLARGKLAIIDGDPGLGKGLVTMDLAARKSAGRAFPGDVGVTQTPGTVILITPEDDIADTIVPRLIAAKADLSRIIILNSITETDPTSGKQVERGVTIPRDVPIIEALATEKHAELLIIDPVLGCLDAGVKTAIDSEVRSALMPLKYMATRTDLSVLLVRHFNKSSNDKAMYRGGASIAFTALCRTAFIMAEHPDNGGKRVVLPVKSNVAKEADGLAFSLFALDDDAVPSVRWDAEPVGLNANDVVGGGAKRSAESREVLDVLREGGVTLPASPEEIALCLGVSADDKSGQARIRQRLSRMTKSGLLCSPVYGRYALPVKQQSHMSQ